MRSRVLRTFGISVSALALATSLSGAANASDGASATVTPGAAAGGTIVQSEPSAKTCAVNDGAWNNDGITAQDFGPNYPELESEGAADFKTGKKACTVGTVELTGYPTAGIATSATVKIYKDKKGLPGKSICKGTTEGSGPDFVVKVKKCTLDKKTTYWLGAQVLQDLETQGQWFWATTNDIQGEIDAWRNPGGGFGTACTDWDNLDACLGLPYDYLFVINKK